jgi:hypothetical protein
MKNSLKLWNHPTFRAICIALIALAVITFIPLSDKDRLNAYEGVGMCALIWFFLVGI